MEAEGSSAGTIEVKATIRNEVIDLTIKFDVRSVKITIQTLSPKVDDMRQDAQPPRVIYICWLLALQS